jgi:hypothetical protein
MVYDEDYSKVPFEEKIKMMEKMTEKQLIESLEQVKYTCRNYCGKCPSYQGTGETELGFCSIGKSSVIKEKKGCLCKQCPISKTMSLRWEHYCTDGSAIDLAVEEKTKDPFG